MRKRSQVLEIIAAKDLLIVSQASGVCCAFDQKTGKRLCFLNVTLDEVVRSIFYNKLNQSIITVSVFKGDNFSSLKCRSVSLEYLRRGEPSGAFELFGGEMLHWPGFVEFDDVNGKVLTFSAQGHAYKVWDLLNYGLLFTISDPAIQEIKVSPGVMLLIYSRQSTHVMLSLVDIHTGQQLRKWPHFLHRSKKIDFIEQFNETLLVKQEGESLQVVDSSGAVSEVPDAEFPTPVAFVFLYEYQMFLTFRNNSVAVWDHHGRPVTRFEDQPINFADVTSSNICISKSQDLILSYHKAGIFEPGVINVSSIKTGRMLGKITARAGEALPGAPLQDVSALSYNEETGVLYTGTKGGLIHCWST